MTDSPLGEHINQKIAELREVISEANGMMKDLHAAIKEARGLHAEIRTDLETRFDDLAGQIVREGLEEYKSSLERAIEEATQGLYKKFDNIVNVLMAEDKDSKRQGRPTTLQVLARAKEQRDNQP
jgi:vacuolar-type H+-ATPase subunit H